LLKFFFELAQGLAWIAEAARFQPLPHPTFYRVLEQKGLELRNVGW
jgi:hypothetical protein